MAVVSIHGDRVQSERETALMEFKLGNRPILIATDVAARGIDINDVEHVINFDFPSTIDMYKHRIGRTGRIGKGGTATTFMNRYTDAHSLEQLKSVLHGTKQSVPDWFDNLYY